MADNKQTSGGSNKPKPGGNTPKPGVSAKDRSRQQSRPVTAKAAKAPAKKGGQPRGGGSGAGGRPPVKKKAGSRPKGPSGAVMAWGAVAVVIVVVVVLVVIKVTSGSPSTNASFTAVTPAPASVVSKVVN
ncbi:MAG TPA: hypothetical protein VHU17_12495, partial [Acidimicrobiales bacterium]|nr:hypothetical protein [Acidimicrobiales bacterium]